MNCATKIGLYNRLTYIDAIRGFLIFLVVFSHVTLFGLHIGPYNNTLTSIMLSSFLELFFFISGYFAYQPPQKLSVSDFFKLIRKKAVQLVIPTVFFFCLYSLFIGSNPVYNFLDKGFDYYWFTWVLFEMFVVYYLLEFVLRSIKSNKRLIDVFLLFLSIVGLIILVFYRDDSKLWLGLCMAKLFKFFQFFVLGILAKKYNEKFLIIIDSQRIRTIVLIVYIISLAVSCWSDLGQTFIGKLIFRDILLSYSGLYCIFMFFFNKSVFFNSGNSISKVMQFMGRRTLDIYMLHYFLVAPLPITEEWVNGNPVCQMIVTVICSIIIILICLLVSEVLRSSDFLAGVKVQKRSI